PSRAPLAARAGPPAASRAMATATAVVLGDQAPARGEERSEVEVVDVSIFLLGLWGTRHRPGSRRSQASSLPSRGFAGLASVSRLGIRSRSGGVAATPSVGRRAFVRSVTT